ncbi:hypothetical protein [Halorhabdus rudnickae]|uniref:hypothetical protein n=1 Tax=Halorhabdus rudnickae TaxID=1775544 RepID=UPI001083E872|nr:hypothetical protein [Halorhabdus rudnickae]
MEHENCPVLAAAVEHYDTTGGPVTPAAIRGLLERDEAAIETRFRQLVDCELLAPVENGYRPTVTGREFLDLDVECGPIIVDTEDSC